MRHCSFFKVIMLRLLLVILLVHPFLLTAEESAARIRTARVVDLNNPDQQWFTHVSLQNSSYWQDIYRLSDDRITLEETLLFDAQGRIREYRWVEPLRDRDGRAYFKNGKIEATWRKYDHSESRTFDLPENLVVSPNLESFILRNLEALKNNHRVDFEILAIAWLRTLPMELKTMKKDENHLLIRMKVDSWFMSLFSKPLYLSWNLRQNRLEKIDGETLVKTPDQNGGWFSPVVSIHYQNWLPAEFSALK